MSRIYFHSEDGTAKLRGSERAHMGILCSELFLAAIGRIWDSPDNPSWLRRYIPPGHYTLVMPDFERAVDTWLRVSDGNLIVNGNRMSIFTLALNTAHVMGNDAIKLSARLHGQCEIHCYVEGENRAWLASIINAGRKQNIFRANEGWEEVCELLLASNEKPVVASYSVTEQFPNAGLVVERGLWKLTEEEEESGDWDRWYELPDKEKWRLGMEALRATSKWLELKPDNWQDYYFDLGVTGFDLVAQLSTANA